MKQRLGVIAILLLALFGLADSTYLAQHELSGAPLLCNIQNLSGCNVVAQSPYSHLFGVPIAVYGILFYAMVFVLAALELVIFDRLLRRVLQAFAVAGILCSLYFTFLQIFVIGALCIYCIGSAVIALLILIAAGFIEPLARALPLPPHGPPTPSHLSMPPTA